MALGLCAQRDRGRLAFVASVEQRGNRGGAAPALRRDDAGGARVDAQTPMQRPSFGGNGQTGNDAIGNRSRFLPDSILSTFAVSAWRLHDDDDDDGGRALGTTASSDIQARIRNRCLDA